MREESEKIILWLNENQEFLDEIKEEYLRIEKKYLTKNSVEELKKDNEELRYVQFQFLEILIDKGYGLKIDKSNFQISEEVDDFIRGEIQELKIK
jgi:hypothetical protein